jgi:hypothetical protein
MVRSSWFALALLMAAACSGGGQTVSVSSLHSCPPFLGGIVDDPAIQPPNGAVGVSPAIGSITVPTTPGLAGATVLLNAGGNTLGVAGGAFGASGASTLTATIPALAAHTTYFAQAIVLVSAGTGPLGCDVYRSYNLGSFTTQ